MRFDTDWLANISVKWVLVAVGILLVLRMSMARGRPTSRHATDSAAEFLESALIAIVLVFLVIRPFVVQAFYIPSGSMQPTLQVGDRILVNKFIYRLTKPDRGDVVVFVAPHQASTDEKDFIKRIIALPGDTIEVVPARVLVDGKTALRLVVQESYGSAFRPNIQPQPALNIGLRSESPEVRDGEVRIERSLGDPLVVKVVPDLNVEVGDSTVYVDGVQVQNFAGHTVTENRNLTSYGADSSVEGTMILVDGEPRLMLVEGRELTAPGAHVEVNGKTMVEPFIAEAPNYAMPPYKVPEGHYFVMGDNRNDSNDSHHWGPLAGRRIIGRAEAIFWPISRIRLIRHD